jgi:aryl-alcohol dehydrogenase-like predicted oxidoreductase
MSEETIQKTKPQRITLGLNGPSISPLGIGTWQWGDKMIWEYGKGGYSDADLEESFQVSLDAGINFFDTAEVYGQGRSETLLGQALRSVPVGSVVVATKFMPLPWRLPRSSLKHALERSLERLGLEKVDLYQVHFPLPPMSIEYWAEGLAEVVEAGLTRAVGVSNHNPGQMSRAFDQLSKHGIHLASNQVRYSLLDRGPEKSGLLRVCQALGVTLIAYSPLAQGMLTGKYGPSHPPSGQRKLIYRGVLADLPELTGALREIGQAHGDKTPAQVALNWLICKGTVPIPGAKNAHQASENAGALGWELSEAEVAQLDELSES